MVTQCARRRIPSLSLSVDGKNNNDHGTVHRRESTRLQGHQGMTKSTEIRYFGARFLSFIAGRLANRFSNHSPYRSPTRRLRES